MKKEIVFCVVMVVVAIALCVDLRNRRSTKRSNAAKVISLSEPKKTNTAMVVFQPKETNCAPGYSVVCDSKGRWATKHGDFVYDTHDMFIYSNRQGAVDNGWNWYRMRQDTNYINQSKMPIHSTIEWKDCD